MTPDERKLQLIAELRKLDPEAGDAVTKAAYGLPERKISSNIQDRRNWSYYKESYGRDIRPALEKLYNDESEDILYRYALFTSIKKQTLYQLIYQAWQWLIDNDTDKEKWADLWARCKVIRDKAGIVITVNHSRFIDQTKLRFESVPRQNKEELAGWKEELYEFLENSKPGSKLDLQKLQLSAEDMALIEVQLKPLQDSGELMYRCSSAHLLILKPTDEQKSVLRTP